MQNVGRVLSALLVLLLAAHLSLAASTTIVDLSGHHNDGTMYNCSVEPDGVRFNGSLDSYILVNDSPSLRLGAHTNSSEPMYRIAIVNDIHIGQNGSIGNQTLPEFVALANTTLFPSLVLAVGDCFESSIGFAARFVDIMSTLSAPWVFVWGDHECDHNMTSPHTLEIKHYLESRGVSADFRRYTYLDVDADGSPDFLLVVMGPYISEDDLSWFDSTFGGTSLPIIVVNHIPEVSPHENMRLSNADEVMAHLRANGHVFAVLTAHDHGYVGATHDNGTWYLAGRRTGSIWGAEPGYSLLDFYANGSVVFSTRQFNHTGVFDYTLVRDATTVAASGFTLEVEFTPESLPAYSYLLDKGTAGHMNYGMAIKGNGAIYVVSHDTMGEVWAESKTGLVRGGTPVHAIAVANNTSLRLLVNGNEVALVPTHPPYTINTNPLYIGRTYSHPFNGTMRMMRIYGRALTDAQIASHFNGSYGAEEGGLVLYYQMGVRTAKLYISPPSQNVITNQTFTIDVGINSSVPVYAAQYNITFNTSVLEVESQIQGPYLSSDGASSTVLINRYSNTKGTAEYAEFRTGTTAGIAGNGTLATITFHVKQNAPRGTYSIAFVPADCRLSDPTASYMERRLVNASVVIGSAPPVAVGVSVFSVNNVHRNAKFDGSGSYDLDGRIVSYYWDFGDGKNRTGASPTHRYATYRWNGTAYEPFTVSLTVRDNSGISNTTTMSVVVYIDGDTNGDGVVDILDAALVGLHWQATYGSSEYSDGADLNNDNIVNILDAAIVGLHWKRGA